MLTKTSTKPRRGIRRQLLPIALCAAAVALPAANPASAAAATTYYVSPTGSDAGAGTQDSPFRSISQAKTVARSGDAVLVESGRYEESVSLDGNSSGVTFKGVGPTRPVVDGGGTRKVGFSTNREVANATIQNFEISGQTDEGVHLQGSSNLLANNVIHHVGAQDNEFGRGVLVWGDHLRVVGNTIHSIGPGGEAMGIMLADARDSQVDGNTIYLVRKEGVRDYMGLDNAITNNRIFLTWTAVAPNQSTGGLIANNYLYDNTQGFNPKHTSLPSTLEYWSLDTPHWAKFWHNTVYRSSQSSIALAMTAPTADYIDIRDNILADAGGAQVADSPGDRGPHVIVDGNAYSSVSGPRWLYHTGYDFAADGYGSLADVRDKLGWEQHGKSIDPQLRDAAGGDLGYDASSAAAQGSIQLPDALGGQLGANGLPPAPVNPTEFPMKPIASSSAGTWHTANHLNETSDGAQQTYWLTSTPSNEFVVFDFGRERTIQYFVLDVYAHFDKRNIRDYRFEVSSDGSHWREVLSGTNPDSEGSAYKYELPSPATGRYVRFTMVDTFCDSYSPRAGCGENFVMSDLRAGTFGSAGIDPPVSSTPVPTPPPSATGPQPAAAVVATPPATLTSGGKVRLALKCPTNRSGACRGAVSVVLAPKPPRGARSAGSGSAPRRLGRRGYRIRRGRRMQVTLTVSRKGLRALRSRAQVFAIVTAATANQQSLLSAVVRVRRVR